MKKVVFFVFVCATAGAQTQGVPTGVRVSPSPDVPAIVGDKFKLEHPNTNTTWSKVGDTNYEATYMNDTTQRPEQVLYSNTGEFLRKRANIEKGRYPLSIDQYYNDNHPNVGYLVWRENKPNTDTSFFGTQGMDSLWFGKAGNYLQEKNKAGGKSKLSEKDRAYLLDISLGNVERISMLFHVSDSSKVISKEVLAGRYSQIDQMVRRFGKSKNIPLPDPMLPVGKIREPTPKDFKRMDKRLMSTLKKTIKKANDKGLKDLASQIVKLEERH